MPITKNYKLSHLTIFIVLLIIVFTISIITAWKIHHNYHLQDKYNQKVANMLVNDITNRMYLNYKEFTKGPNSLYITTNPKQQITINHNINYACYNSPNGCDPLSIAANDILNWQQAIKNNLPNGIGIISWSSEDHTIEVQVSWNFSTKRTQKSFITNKILPYQNSYDTH